MPVCSLVVFSRSLGIYARPAPESSIRTIFSHLFAKSLRICFERFYFPLCFGVTPVYKDCYGCFKRVPSFKGFQQQDSHELLRNLLDAVKSEEIKVNNCNVSPNMFLSVCDISKSRFLNSFDQGVINNG